MAWLAILCGYLLGSTPFALLIAGPEVRTTGSGNPGATNVWRVRGSVAALAVLVLDVSKGCAAVWLATQMGTDVVTTTAVAGAAVAGHVFPIWLGFDGGKGVATAFGVFLLLSLPSALVSLAAFIIAAGTSRYVSVGSMVAAFCLPVAVVFLGGKVPLVVLAVAVAALVVFRHRSNLARLQAGGEPRLGEGRIVGPRSREKRKAK